MTESTSLPRPATMRRAVQIPRCFFRATVPENRAPVLGRAPRASWSRSLRKQQPMRRSPEAVVDSCVKAWSWLMKLDQQLSPAASKGPIVSHQHDHRRRLCHCQCTRDRVMSRTPLAGPASATRTRGCLCRATLRAASSGSYLPAVQLSSCHLAAWPLARASALYDAWAAARDTGECTSSRRSVGSSAHAPAAGGQAPPAARAVRVGPFTTRSGRIAPCSACAH